MRGWERRAISCLAAVVLACIGAGAARADGATPLTLADSTQDVLLSSFLEVLAGSRTTDSFESIRSSADTAQFVPFDDVGRSLQSTGRRYWFRLAVHNNSQNEDWILAFLPTTLPEVAIYLPDEKGGYTRHVTSANAPFAERLVEHRYVVYPIELAPGATATVYMHMLAEQSYSMGMWTYEGFLKHSRNNELLLGLFYGMAIAMALYNLFLFLRLRDTSYLYYALFVLMFSLVLAYRDGTAAEYFHPRTLGGAGSLSADLFANLTAVFAFLFVRRFLDMRRHSRLLHLLFVALAGTYGLLSIMFFIVRTPAMTVVATAGVIPGLVIFFVAVGYMLRKGFRPAQYLLYGMAPPFIITIAYGVSNLGLMVNMALIVPVIYVSFVLSSILFSLALADRIHVLQEEQRSTERMNLSKTEFFVNLAHEVKTPLMVISNYLDSYIRGHGLDRELTVVKRSVEKLSRDMVQFFDVLRLEKGINLFSQTIWCNFSDIVTDRVVLFERLCDSRQVTLRSSIAASLFVLADPTALGRIVDNLLENAVRYNRPGGTVDLVLCRRGESVVLAVADTGIGIERRYLSEIFEPYYQVSRVKLSSQGIGMGLNLVRQIMDTVGGSVSVASELGEGTTFTVTFPGAVTEAGGGAVDVGRPPSTIAPAGDIEDHAGSVMREGAGGPSDGGSWDAAFAPDVADLPADEVVDSERLTVLVVEDNRDLLALIAARLNERYRALSASCGEEALEKLRKAPACSLIITDVMMDRMSGFELLERLQCDPQYEKIPCIFISAKTSHEDRMTGLSAGAIDYIYKPFSVDELLVKVESLTRLQARARRRHEQAQLLSLRALVSGFSHEIGNPLSGVTGPLENLRRRLAELGAFDDSHVQKHLRFIGESVARIQEVAAAFRLLAGERSYLRRPLRIEKIVESTLSGFETVLPPEVRLVTHIEDAAEAVGDERAVRLVLRNLVANAVDAVGSAGEVSVSVARRNLGTALIVRDDGIGIPPDRVDRIFDPFFTGKEPGAGMGVGLFLVKRICLDLGWNIAIDSNPGQGTTATVVLTNPAATEKVTSS